MEPLQFNYRSSVISYYRFGSGPKPVICFHGYGEEATLFEFLSKYAGTQFTFFSIDLPFHGKTEWKDGLNFTQRDLENIVEEVLKQHVSESQMPALRSASRPALLRWDSKLTLLGYSLGGRAALCLYQAMPDKVEKLVLLAPDGLKVNSWYWLATQTWMGNKLFYFTMKHPGWFFGMLKALNRLQLVNTSVFKFVNYYVGNSAARRLLYARWIALRKLKPDLKYIKSLVRKNNIQVRLVYGQHDRIILSAVGERFKKGIEGQCTLSVIASGHQVLHEKHVQEILPALLH